MPLTWAAGFLKTDKVTVLFISATVVPPAGGHSWMQQTLQRKPMYIINYTHSLSVERAVKVAPKQEHMCHWPQQGSTIAQTHVQVKPANEQSTSGKECNTAQICGHLAKGRPVRRADGRPWQILLKLGYYVMLLCFLLLAIIIALLTWYYAWNLNS